VFISMLIGNALLWQRIQFIPHDPTVSARAIALQIVYVARGTLPPANDVRNRRQVIGMQAKPADLRVRVEMRRVDGADDRRGDLAGPASTRVATEAISVSCFAAIRASTPVVLGTGPSRRNRR
jgi:hypothetical protein